MKLLNNKTKLLIASHNKGKIKEFKNFFSVKNLDLLSLEKFSNKKPLENGNTFKSNALIKAKHASSLVNFSIPSLADDSGICIEKLDCKPGIYSARWAKNNNYLCAFKKIKKEFEKKKLNMENQNAKFVCFIAFINTEKKRFFYSGELEGKLTFPPRGDEGFGYDPIFIPKGYTETLSELNYKIKNKISHRKIAIDKFLNDHYK